MSALTEEELYYLRANFEVAPDGGPDDPNLQGLSTCQANILEVEGGAPVWTRGQVESCVSSLALEHDLRVKLVWKQGLLFPCAYVGRRGGVIQLSAEKTFHDFNDLAEGEHSAVVVLHEFAHILTQDIGRVDTSGGKSKPQSHGREFVECFVHLLRRHMDTVRFEEALDFMGVLR